MTTAFYAPPARFVGGQVTLPDDEARHAVRVLRMQPGDALVVVDGVGGWHEAVLTHTTKRDAVAEVVTTQHDVGEPPYVLTVGLALLKNRNRFETFLEKAVELGARRVVPLQTARTERRAWKPERWHNILVAAMKQTGRSRLLDLTPPQPLEEVLAETEHDLALFCHEAADPAASLAQRLGVQKSAATLAVLVGPEGGFTDEEVASAEARGWQPTSLGTRRLRAETAAIAAAAGVMLYRTGTAPEPG